MDELITTSGPLHRQLEHIQGRLQQAFPPGRFTHDMVPARLDAGVWNSMARQAPFIGLAFLGIKDAPSNGRLYDGTVLWRVFLVAKNPRLLERFAGDSRNVGLFGLVQAATIFLHGWTPPVPADQRDAEGTITVGAVNNVYGADWLAADAVCATVEVDAPIRVTTQYRAEELLQITESWPSEDAGGGPSISDTHDVRQDQ